MRAPMKRISLGNVEVFLPMPVFPLVEDVGWWQGEDGSGKQQPYRNAFPRRHCLADYQALVRFGKRIGVRIGLGMVLGEWDRYNVLKNVPGATWMGRAWDNRTNQGPWLEEAAGYLRSNPDVLELGLHGLCHEFWNEGKMERSEFHDQDGRMRSPQVIRAHLDAFASILEHNGFSEFPRLFVPPALNHSFGNGQESIQALLHGYGIRYLATRFARARQFVPPRHEKMTWECGVGLLERGLSPVPWYASASTPLWDFSGPILPLHWGNLLHVDPQRNVDVVDSWGEMLLNRTSGPECILTEDFAACWRQAAMLAFGDFFVERSAVVVDWGQRPKDMPGACGTFWLKMHADRQRALVVHGAQILSDRLGSSNIRSLQILPENDIRRVALTFK